MERNIWERSLEEREEKQKGLVREALIGAYAAREPLVMDLIFRFLQYEKKFPLDLVHKIADRMARITVCTIVVTHDEIMQIVKDLPEQFAIARGPCACRLHTAGPLGPDARDLAAGDLRLCRQTPLNVDIQIAACGTKFGTLNTYRRIDKEELLALEDECFNLGLVSNIYIIMGGEAGICHCSSATCVPLLANEAIGGKSSVIVKGKFIARTDPALCDAAGDCVKVCHFHARRLVDKDGRKVLSVDAGRCYGCGLCAAVCPRGAIAMVPRRA